MTNFNEELRKIMEQIHCGTCECDISGLSHDQAISAITALVKGIVPGEEPQKIEELYIHQNFTQDKVELRVMINKINEIIKVINNKTCRSEMLEKLK